MNGLKGKIAVVTGARRGIGRAVVEELASSGCDVWASIRTQDGEFEQWAQMLASRYNVTVTPLVFDITDDAATKDAVKTIRASKKRVDILVNNAGITSASASFPMTSLESVSHVIQVNLIAQMRVTQYMLRYMNPASAIVNLSSIAAQGGMPGQYGYACSKAAVEAWTKTLAQELGGSVRVNAVAPGFVDTDMGNEAAGDLLSRVLASTVMGRMATPEEIAHVIAFLASDNASFLTGEVVKVTGGGSLLNG